MTTVNFFSTILYFLFYNEMSDRKINQINHNDKSSMISDTYFLGKGLEFSRIMIIVHVLGQNCQYLTLIHMVNNKRKKSCLKLIICNELKHLAIRKSLRICSLFIYWFYSFLNPGRCIARRTPSQFAVQ